MKKTEKKLLTIIGLIIVLFVQWYLVEKPRRARDDHNIRTVKLVRVVDGDTLIVNILNKEEKIRLIGMDAPESVKPNSPVECFGVEASLYLADILGGKELHFVQDSSQDTRDKYGRLLGYIFIGEENLAEKMIADGYAYEYTYDNPYRYQRNFRTAERIARREERGLWSPDVCNGKA